MTLDAIPTGEAVFVDANPFLHYFTAHPAYGAACQQLLQRIENKDLLGFTSAHVLHEVVHRLMTIEACARFTFPAKGIAHRLRRHPAEVQQLNRSRQAVDEVTLIGVDVLPINKSLVSLAVDVSGQSGLLSSDALIVAIMRTNGLTNLASKDADFDRVAGLTRYAPV